MAQHSDTGSQYRCGTPQMGQNYLNVWILALSSRDNKVCCRFERLVWRLGKHSSVPFFLFVYCPLRLTSTIGIPRNAWGKGAEDGVWAPCRKTRAFLWFNSSQILSYLSSPTYTADSYTVTFWCRLDWKHEPALDPSPYDDVRAIPSAFSSSNV